MGVQGLSTRLQPYARPFSWDSISKPGCEEDLSAVIDGPALAYYVYYLCLNSSSGDRLGIANLPTYGTIGDAAIGLLDELERFGLYVDSIYFDGQLPESKLAIRNERLLKSLAVLRRFQTIHSEHLRSTCRENNTEPIFLALFSRSKSSKPISGLPELPFLVPAVIDALKQSEKYNRRTKTVPGEADIFCGLRSEHIKSGLIFTNDSDLILLHPRCNVVFFNELNFNAQLSTLHGFFYAPSDIAKQLDCPNLILLGYEVMRQPGRTLKQCSTLIKKGDVNEQDESYQEFARGYRPLRHASCDLPLDCEELRTALESLDPRVSELVLTCVPEAPDTNAPLRMYLPPLIDDPSRASAWRTSTIIRRLAYSVLSTWNTNLTVVLEVDRRGQRFVEEEVELYTLSQLNEELSNISEALDRVQGKSSASAWRLFGLLQVLALIENQALALPNTDDVEALASSRKLSWSAMHLHAQIDGLLYSFRILHQVLGVWVALSRLSSHTKGSKNESTKAKISAADTDQQSLHGVHRVLQELPPLRDLHSNPGEPFAIDITLALLSEHLSEFYGEKFPIERSEKVAEIQSKKARKKAKLEARSASSQTTGVKASANVFDWLQET